MYLPTFLFDDNILFLPPSLLTVKIRFLSTLFQFPVSSTFQLTIPIRYPRSPSSFDTLCLPPPLLSPFPQSLSHCFHSPLLQPPSMIIGAWMTDEGRESKEPRLEALLARSPWRNPSQRQVVITVRERERERERGREREREIDRETDRQTDRQRERERV